MKKAAVKVLSYFLLTAAGIAVGGGGSYAALLFTQPDDMAVIEVASVQPQPDTEAVQLRVRGGQMEWFDGVRWNTAAAVEDLRQNDAAGAESDAWHALVQQRASAKEAQRAESLSQLDRAQMDLTVGEKPAAQQPTTTRRPTASTTPQTPSGGGGAATTPPPAQTQPPAGGGDNSGGNSNGGDGWSGDYE